MIVPAKRRFFGAGRFARGNLKRGETFSVDSGLGGSWTIAFDRFTDDGALIFVREERDDWPHETYRYADPTEASEHVYILIPDYPR